MPGRDAGRIGDRINTSSLRCSGISAQAAGIDAFAVDVTGYSISLQLAPIGRIGHDDARLVFLLDKCAVWLQDAAVEARLTARLEERDALLKMVKLAASDSAALAPAVEDSRPPVNGTGDRDRQVSDGLVDVDPVPADQPVADISADEPEQLAAIPTDQPKGGQAEMPLVTTKDADKAPVDGDDKG